jgi:hypothetical protein
MNFISILDANDKASAPQKTEAFFKLANKVEAGKPNGLVYDLNQKDENGNDYPRKQRDSICNFEVEDLYMQESKDYDASVKLTLRVFSPDNSQSFKASLSFGAAVDLDTHKYSTKLDLLWKLLNLKGQRIKSLSVKVGEHYPVQGTGKDGKKYKSTLANLNTALTIQTGTVPQVKDWYEKKSAENDNKGRVKTLGVLGDAEFLPDDAIQLVTYWCDRFATATTTTYDPELNQTENVDFETGEMLLKTEPQQYANNSGGSDLPF